jgi:hypothetical protein
MREPRVPVLREASRTETHTIVLARHELSELCQYPSHKMRGRSAEMALGCLRGTLLRASNVCPQAFARRLESLAIGTLAARRSTRGICGLRPSERTMLISTGPTSSRNLPALLARQRHGTPHRVLLKLMPRESTLGGRDSHEGSQEEENVKEKPRYQQPMSITPAQTCRKADEIGTSLCTGIACRCS